MKSVAMAGSLRIGAVLQAVRVADHLGQERGHGAEVDGSLFRRHVDGPMDERADEGPIGFRATSAKLTEQPVDAGLVLTL